MNIFTKSFNPPKTLTTPLFQIFPTNNDFFQSDYKAVMANKELLREWSQSSWPEDDFTPQQNFDDLLQHIDDNHTHAAYGYMIYSPDLKTCYGSVYVNPIASVPENYQTTFEEALIIKGHQARIDCWIVEDTSDLEKIIIKELISWFEEVWEIRVLFSARPKLMKRMDIYKELNRPLKMNVQSKTSDMKLLLF